MPCAGQGAAKSGGKKALGISKCKWSKSKRAPAVTPEPVSDFNARFF
jgi:hypothetical protein